MSKKIKPFIPVNTPLLSGNEEKYLLDCIKTGWISSEGPYVKKFENSFSEYIGQKFGVAVSNGSAALDIAVKSLDLKEGDEVIMPAFTIISPALSIVRAGAKPVLVDSEHDTWNMNVNLIEEKITKHTKAIMVVHIYGLPVDMDAVQNLCNKYNLFLIEDAAEVHGLTYKNKMCGSFGDISIFSFYPNKHITTGEGGMILTSNPNLVEKCKKLRNLAFEPNKPRFVHYDIGWNYRMTNMQAALGLAQLEKIDFHIQKKRKIGLKYIEYLSKIKSITVNMKENEFAKSIFWVNGILINNEKIIASEIIKKLSENGIGCRPFFYPMHLQPIFLKMGIFINEKYPIAEMISKQGLYLPSGLGLDLKDIPYIVSVLEKVLNEKL